MIRPSPLHKAAIRSTGRAAGPLESEESRVTERFLPSRLNALAFDVFAGFGIFLATIGIYASVVYGVTRRAHEVGIRMALGAARWSIVGTLAGRQVSLALRGVIVGLLGVLALRRVLDSFLLASGGSDAWFLVGSGLVCLGVVLAATCIPVWRATRADTAMALRME
jgi:ABC-type antimicrobial peptide transport system permease subunit